MLRFARYLPGIVLVAVAGATTISAGQTISVQGDFIGGVAGTTAVQDGRPARDQPPPPTGTSKIRGRLIDAGTGAPLRRATVRANANEIRIARTTMTDGQGGYEFTELPAGRYVLNASKAGYVALAYGQKASTDVSKPVQLGDRQTLERIDLALPRGAVITGRVLDEYGEPLPDTQVMPVRMMYVGTGRRPVPVGQTATTNDIGEFRIYGLAAGQYYLSATARPANMAFADFGNGPVTARDENHSGYAPTFYPSASSIAEAQPLTVGVGETLPEVVVTLVPTRTSRISGVVSGMQGEPASGGFLNAVPMNDNGLGMMAGGNGGPIGRDGTFLLNGVPPGRYLLRANVFDNRGGPGPGRGGTPGLAVAMVTVNGEDISGVRLEPLIPVTLEGRLVVDPAAAQSLKPGSIRIAVAAARFGDPRGPAVPGPPPVVNDDLTFAIQIYPDTPLVLRAAGLPPGWMIRAITMNGADVTDGVTVRSDNTATVDVELSNRAPTTTGQATDSSGTVSKDYTVIAFPQDRDRWTSLGFGRSANARADDQGRFTIRSLIPGSYYFLAVDRLDQNQWLDPEYLDRARASATRVNLAEGDTKTLDLKVTTVRQ